MWKKCGTPVVLLVLLTPAVHAQIPGPPAAVAPPVVAPPVAAPVVPVAPAGKLANLCATLAVCKEKFCISPIGQFINNGLAPVRVFTGGLVGTCCPPLGTAAELAAPPDSADGAAARIKADEEAAKQRRLNVRYLGTVDCRYWPEAQEALINALRADRNECVRWEAALALSRGCCCTKATIQALTLTVTCSEEDGRPAEPSERVRSTAWVALTSCLARVTEPVVVTPIDELPPPKELPPEKPDAPVPGAAPPPAATPPATPPAATAPAATAPAPKADGPPLTYYQKINRLPLAVVVANARKALAKMTNTPAAPAMPPARPDGGSVFGVVHSSMAPAAGGGGPHQQATTGLVVWQSPQGHQPPQVSPPAQVSQPTPGQVNPAVYQAPVRPNPYPAFNANTTWTPAPETPR